MRLDKGTFFKDLLEAISDRFSKAYFVFSDKGLDVQAVDSSGFALVALLLPFEAFDYYRCDRAVSGGLSLVDMAKAFRRANDETSSPSRPWATGSTSLPSRSRRPMV